MAKFYYQQIDEIGKQIAVVSTPCEITDRVNYRPVDKDYYDAVIEFLRENAVVEESEE